MSEGTVTRQRLASRLLDLRQSWNDAVVTQKHVAEAFGISTGLVSSWENASAVPPEERLKSYARFFTTRRSIEGGAGHLVPAEDLTPAEERKRADLVDELVRLREEALNPTVTATRDAGALGGQFWYYPDTQPITILCTPLSDRQLGLVDEDGTPSDCVPPAASYATNQSHPNWVRSLRNADMDALIELVGHLRAENPASPVRWYTFDTIQDRAADLLTGHLVILGGGDSQISGVDTESPLGYFIRELELPVQARLPEEGDDQYDTEFVVRVNQEGEPDYEGASEEVYRPRFLRDEKAPGRPRLLVDGVPPLEYDVALVARQPNPLNQAAKVTVLSGVFSRGTYGAVRLFTDANLRARNERYLSSNVGDPDDFWMLVQVPVYAGQRTITPDLGRALHRLRTS